MSDLQESYKAFIQKLVQVKRRKSYLFYGPGGSGKTTLAAKHPGKRKLWLDMDDRLGELDNLTDDDRNC